MNKSSLLLGIFGIIVSILSCQKENLDSVSHYSSKTSNPIVFNIDDRVNNRTPSKTILENRRQNPFTVEKMAEAHRNLYGSTLTEMTTTHQYIKFEPQTIEQAILLEESGIIYYDYPLEYKVIEMGDYYQELSEDELPELYAVVSPNENLPSVPRTLIANLYLDKSDPLLIAESFRLTQNTTDLSAHIKGFNQHQRNGNNPPLPTGHLPPPPECDPGCTAILQIDDSTLPLSYYWICDCSNPPPPPTPYINECGCEVNQYAGFPGGCVKVQDTELSEPDNPDTFEGLRRVKIITKDNWFTEDVTWTDDNGCWNVIDSYSGKAWMWVQFSNDRCRIRGTADNWRALWEWTTTVKDFVGCLDGPDFNNISVNYHMWNEQGSQGHRYWGAATVNNAVHEFHDFANQDGINPPPDDLDIYIGKNTTYGYALMSAQSVISITSGTVLAAATFWTGPFAPIIGGISMGIMQAILPDIHIGINFLSSDRQKALAYHELAHASHFSQVGSIFWEQLVLAEIFANGHGDQNSDNADLIAVCESWAGHIGNSYAHRKYPTNAVTSIASTWEFREERRWNESENHIPVGLYHDLADMGTEPESCNIDGSDCTVVSDNVSDFTNDQMFSCLTHTTTAISSFQTCLIENHLSSTTNSVAQVNALFDSY